jgi:hypothetical protein
MPKGEVFVGATVVEVFADGEGSSSAVCFGRRSNRRIAADAPGIQMLAGPVDLVGTWMDGYVTFE